jgi:hypothetical protein
VSGEASSSARFSQTADGSHLLHIVDGDMEILVEIWPECVGVALHHDGRDRLMDFESPNASPSATPEDKQ